jgi:mannose-6-phosphate isomerase-like protein (cupin superfamily)
MNRITATISIAAAFAAGCGVTYLMQPASAASENFTAQIIHVPDLIGDALGPANAVGFRNKMFASADGGTVSVQDGNVPKHLHPNANEVQYILEGTGTIWLGDKEVRIKPGDLVIIPHGTAHGGTKPDGGGSIRAIGIKTPPQTPDDVKLLD